MTEFMVDVNGTSVPITDVEELKMKLSGAEAAINGMREQINRMVIINSEKVSVVRCNDCKFYRRCTDNLGFCTNRYMEGVIVPDWYCADGERKDDA